MLKQLFNDTILKRMFKNASVLFSGTTIAGMMGLISLSLAARALGTERLGVFAMIQAFVLIIDRLLNFQCWQAVIKFGADFLQQDRKDDFKSLVKFCTILDMATAVIGTVIAILIIVTFGRYKSWQHETIIAAIIYSFWILFNLRGTATGLLKLFNKFRLIAAANVTAAFLKVILAFIAYLFSDELLMFVLIWVGAGIAESVLLLIYAWRQTCKETGDNFLKAKLFITIRDKNIWKFVLSTNLYLSVRLASIELDVLIVGAVLGAAATGLYKIARQFAWILAQLIEPIYQSIYPELARLAAEEQFADLKRVAAKTAAITGSTSLLIWLGAIIFGKWILTVAVGKDYMQAYNTMVTFMFAFVIWGFSFGIAAGLLAIGRAGRALMAQTIALAVFLPVLYLLLFNIGLTGAAVAQIVYFSVYLLFISLFFVKYTSKVNLC